MSEPVSNAEIEDVLSSIRRLVSENAGAGRRGDAAQGAPEKLVLTPAFRIDEGEADDASAAAEESEVVSLDRDRWTDGGPEAVEEAVAAAVEDLAGVQVDDEGADPVAQAGEDTAIESPPSDDTAEFDPATDAAPESYQSELERRIAELEAVIARSASDFEPDGSEDDAMDDPVMFHHGVEMAEAEPEAEPENDMDAPVDDAANEAGDRVQPWTAESFATPDVTGQPEDGAQAVADAAQTEAADDETGATDEAPAEEPASFEDDLVTPEALHAAGEAGAADAWEDVEPTDEPGEDDDAEAVLDEDALREMVSRMVREELQGSVGERITHNVRRMVRREIARALALQDFE